MKYKITAPDSLHGHICLPSSKSISNRVLIIKELTEGMCRIRQLSDCDDTRVLQEALEMLNSGETGEINISSCGTAMRFLTALIAIREKADIVLSGNERMSHRPIGILVDALRQLGADIEYIEEEGFPPLRIRGRQLTGGAVEMLGGVSSQFISALMMIAPKLKEGLQIRLLGDIVSRPYIDLTVWTMQQFGAKVTWTDTNTISIESSPYLPHDFCVEKDWSAASYWYETMALSKIGDDADTDSEIILDSLTDGSKQGDTAARYLFSLLGVQTEFRDDDTLLRKTRESLPRLNFDFANQGDLVQTIAVTCCALGTKFAFTSLGTLRIKETDRIVALYQQLHRLGYGVSIGENNQLVFDGTYHPAELEVATYDDHRMAMAFAPLALRFPYIIIDSPEVVSKSYPAFWSDIQSIGFKIEGI